jgi:hypothetical protein
MKFTTFVAATALAFATLPVVWAQTQPRPGGDKPPAATAPAEKIQPQWYSRQGGEINVGRLIGADVVNTANEDVGEVNGVILSKDGKVVAVILGVGGFLGIGEREVAVEFNSIRFAQDGGRPVVTIDATKDKLRNAPEWKWSPEDKHYRAR